MPRNLEIAVIDDDESFRVALVESLSSLGYGSGGYASAEDYVGAIGDRSFNCIVTDIHMPGMSGLDLMKRLAARGSTTPVVLTRHVPIRIWKPEPRASARRGCSENHLK